MTMSVGLAKIQNDPEASVMTRKALGALSTPGLLVHDTGLSIDGDGRIIIKLKEDGGILQDEEGLYLEPEPIVIGIDSHVELLSEAYDRDWNARLTGSAPNYFESGLAIGSEEFGGIYGGGLDAEPAKVNITATHTQLRLSYTPSNYLAIRVSPVGVAEVYCVGTSDPGIHILTGDGTGDGIDGGFQLNLSSILQRFYAGGVNLSFAGGGVVGTISWQEIAINLSGTYVFSQGSTVAVSCPVDAAGVPAQVISWSTRMSADNQLSVRIAWFDVLAPVVITWLFSVHRYVG